MILIDAGPLVALANLRDKDHIRCTETASKLSEVRLITTWPCLAEAMHLLGREGGIHFQLPLWDLIQSEVMDVHTLSISERDNMRALMEKYSDSPMDFADASLVAAAETLNISHIFTIDRHFHAYRLVNGSALQVVP